MTQPAQSGTPQLEDFIDLSDCALIQLRYKINGEMYVLTEASGDVACKRSNRIFASLNMDRNGKVVSMSKDTADLEPWLVSLCLKKEETGEAVPEETIRSWSNRIQKRLFNDLKRISEFDDPDKEKDDKDTEEDKDPEGAETSPEVEEEQSPND